MRDHPWTRAAIGGGIGLLAALLLGFAVAVFRFPTGIGLAVFLGAVIASIRPIPAVAVVWTVLAYWLALISGGDGDFGTAGFVRAWGPRTALWLVGMEVIAVAWLVDRAGWPSRGVTALLLGGIFVTLLGSLMWGSLVGVPAHTLLLNIPNSTLWKVVLVPGLASYATGFVLAFRQAQSRVSPDSDARGRGWLAPLSILAVSAVAFSVFYWVVFAPSFIA